MDFDDCSTITALGNRMVWILRLTIKMTMKIKNRKEYKIALSFVTGVGMRLECFKMYLKRTQGKDPLFKIRVGEISLLILIINIIYTHTRK